MTKRNESKCLHVDVTRQCVCARDCERAFMSPLTREPTKISIRRNVDTLMAFLRPPSCGLHIRGVVLYHVHYVAKPSSHHDSVKHYSFRADSFHCDGISKNPSEI